MVGRVRHLDHQAVVGDGLAMGDTLLCCFELADDLHRCVPGAFHSGVTGSVWPVEDSHRPATYFWGSLHVKIGMTCSFVDGNMHLVIASTPRTGLATIACDGMAYPLEPG